LASNGVRISGIFSSDLQRAFGTAESIRLAQPVPLVETTKLELLREQDFGSYEGKAYAERPRGADKRGQDAHLASVHNDPDFKDRESKDSMTRRMRTFMDSYLVPLLDNGADDDTVAVIAHGIILSYLWKGILVRFDPRNIGLSPSVMVADRGMGLQYLGGWSNTGYMDLEIKRRPISAPAASTTFPSEPESSTVDLTSKSTSAVYETPTSRIATGLAEPETLHGIISMPSQASLNFLTPLPQLSFQHLSLTVRAVNNQDHVRDFKKTRGGIGSLKYDEKQTTMDSFVKRRKI
jgi:broad specificity phosphatase PhoE